LNAKVELEGVYAPSEDVVVREIEGELIIVPLASGIGDMEDELYSLNETGRAIIEKLDGRRNLREVIATLSVEYQSSERELDRDVVGFVEELFRRKILVRTPG
jgi:hypothetical protein